MTMLAEEDTKNDITNGTAVNIPKINKNRIRQRIIDESKFISDLFLLTGIPSREDEDEEDDDSVYVSDKKKNPEDARAVHRAKSYRELSEKYEKLKSTVDYSVKAKLMKKSLARRLKKKAMAEEKRSMKKKLTKMKKKQGNMMKQEKNVKEIQENKDIVKQNKPVFNNDGKMVFSKFDFSESGITENKKRGERDPKRILETLQKQKEVIKDLRQAGEVEKASKIVEKISWKNAFAKVEGEKVKDDPTLLKKTVKKKEQQKQRSAKKWQQRLETLEKSKQDKQKKRETNLNKRKQEKKKKVMKKAVKKGRLIP